MDIIQKFHVHLQVKNNSDMIPTMIGTGDNVLISPDLTGLAKWAEGTNWSDFTEIVKNS